MPAQLANAAYVVAALLFILSLAGLSRQDSAKRGNQCGIAGMGIALVATVFSTGGAGLAWVLPAMLIGGGIGLFYAARVQMTEMPELVAILHSFVGMAAVLVGFNTALAEGEGSAMQGAALGIHHAEVFLGVVIGAITFTGSVTAFCKLRGMIASSPLMLPHRHKLNALAGLALIALMVLVVRGGTDARGLWLLAAATLLAFVLGFHLIASIGGADMPVVISMLNSYSGWAAAAAGFMLANDLLIITGALVGSSGAILSYIMCRAMNRSFISVIAGGFGSDAAGSGGGEQGEHQETSAEETAQWLRDAKNVVITPGYGMAVSHAQYIVHDITEKLIAAGIRVRFAIHPVAGRLPGHMNVLLAEAKVPYDIVLGMEEINDDFAQTDVVLVIGANDTVNPAAMQDPQSPIAGMPVLKVWEAKHTIVFKRSMNTGYAGVQNPLFFMDNTYMLFGDAKESAEEIAGVLSGYQ